MKKRLSPNSEPARNRAGHELSDILRYAVTDSPATVMITNLDGSIEYVNKTFCELTGYTLADVFDQKISMLTSGLLSASIYRTLWRHLRKGKSWTGELHCRKKNGEPYWEQASISSICDGEGQVRHYLKIGEDITLRKRLEMDLTETVAKLRSREARLKATCRKLAATTRALNKSQDKLQRLSQEDALTGLLNRRGFNSALRRAKALAERQGHGIGFLIIDIDDFKRLNDRYGHATGDRILKACAALLRDRLRASDLICRYGGDELLVALPAADAETTRLAAERIIAAVRQYVCSKGSAKLSITVSVGAACGFPQQGQSLEKILRQADRALYRVKRNGRDGMAFWPSDPAQADGVSARDKLGEGARSRPAIRTAPERSPRIPWRCS